jgi:hypothetical protein
MVLQWPRLSFHEQSLKNMAKDYSLMSDIAINLVFEDSLSGSVLQRLLANSDKNYVVGHRYNSGGYGWIRQKINGLNRAARGMSYLVLTDLDRYECPPILMDEWLIGDRHHNLIFRVAEKQVESWLLGCRALFAKFLGVRENLIPRNVDEITNAKAFLIDLARQSPRKRLRLDIVPREGSTARVGPDYNGRLVHFVESIWDPNIAKELSPSLRRAMRVLDRFEPTIE